MLENIHCPIPEMASEYRQLLSRWQGRDITDQFEVDICEILTKYDKCLEDFRFRPLPTPTQEYKKWRWMKEIEKEKFIKDNREFYDKNIIGFGEDVIRIKNLNKRNFESLNKYLQLPISISSRNKIIDVIRTFPKDLS